MAISFSKPEHGRSPGLGDESQVGTDVTSPYSSRDGAVGWEQAMEVADAITVAA